MLYQICGGAVSYGGSAVLKNINFEIRNTEKIAVVGRNGCGKTTLLKLILGELELEKKSSDENSFISRAGDPVIGCLKQMTFEDNTVKLSDEIRKVFKPILQMKARMDELVDTIDKTGGSDEKLINEYSNLESRFSYLGGYNYEKDYDLIVERFGFTEEDLAKPLSEFSGGQRTKIAFIKLLLSKPDILLLDEPTNHLDISTIGWLEGYLKQYPRAVVIVSHDRMFLDRVAEVVYEIEHNTLKRYVGNYSEFVLRKKEDFEKQEKEYERQQKEIERLNNIVERFKNTPTKVAMTRSKLKAIEHMDKIEKPESADERAFNTSLSINQVSGNDVLSVDNLGIGYDEVLSKVTFELKKGQKVGIIGGNGLGKSTFLKTITEQIPKKSGKYKYGYNVDVGYFDQQMAQYSSDKQVIDELWDEFPTLTETEIRNILGGFLFRGEDVFKNVNMLSGGEKVRLALAKLFQRRPNLLILDEPTNHMDIVGKEALEEMLKSFDGTVLFVSHDRYFIKQVADALLIFQGGTTMYFPYGYEAYEEKYGAENKGSFTDEALRLNAGKTDEEKAVTKKSDAEKNYSNPGKELSKAKKRVERLEKLIEDNEIRLEELRNQLADPAISSDYVKLAAIQDEISAKETENEGYMDEWAELSEIIGE
ncbi:MAG: ABC-F family ATP-binding cassette domain-containing protein [Lachnospiraceae bacterium]|nr:ABC-F family ATP-binding cassette domain-containing protein [Lachnospiraceae bacterium]